MEWDIGMFWYCFICVCYVISGSEFGWWMGFGKWFVYYMDNLFVVINFGQGLFIVVVMGKDLDFFVEYKGGMFVFDWSFGIIYYVVLNLSGSIYKGEKQEFFSGILLFLIDVIVGFDGVLYFVLGGRKLDF